MKFKEVEIIKDSTLFSGVKIIATYHDYYSDQEEMIEKITSCVPRKGDVIAVIDKENVHRKIFIKVKHICINYINDKMTIWC